MKKLTLLLTLFILSIFLNGVVGVAENNGESNNSMEVFLENERLERERFERELYLSNLVQDIELEAEVKIPDYFDVEYVEFTYKLSKELELSTRMVFRLMYKESNFRDTVASPVGAYGLMQLMPATRAMFYEILCVDTLNYDRNQEDIYIGLQLIKTLHCFWTDRGNSEGYSWKLSLASYNAGKGRVLRYKGIPPYKETINYIDFIMRKHSDPELYAEIINKLNNGYSS